MYIIKTYRLNQSLSYCIKKNSDIIYKKTMFENKHLDKSQVKYIKIKHTNVKKYKTVSHQYLIMYSLEQIVLLQIRDNAKKTNNSSRRQSNIFMHLMAEFQST